MNKRQSPALDKHCTPHNTWECDAPAVSAVLPPEQQPQVLSTGLPTAQSAFEHSLGFVVSRLDRLFCPRPHRLVPLCPFFPLVAAPALSCVVQTRVRPVLVESSVSDVHSP